MRKSPMQKLVVTSITAFTVLGGTGATHAHMRGGSHVGRGGFHDGDGLSH
jgi:hypothetical protein